MSILTRCTPLQPNIICDSNIEDLELKFQKQFMADRVEISSLVLKEEIYFPTWIILQVEIYNPFTTTLDFKSLSVTKYDRLENYTEIQEGLKNDGTIIFEDLKKKCHRNDFDRVIIKFTKPMDNPKLNYSVGCHYIWDQNDK